MDLLANVHEKQYKLKQAEEIYREALNFSKAYLQPIDIGNSMYRLAYVILKQNKLNQVEELFQNVVNFRKTHILPNHPDHKSFIINETNLQNEFII